MKVLVIDTQKLITNEKLHEYHTFLSNVKAILAKARENHVEILYVRHDDGAGNELTKGNPGYDIYEGFAPMQGEKIFDKIVNSPFKESGLLEYLREKKETELMVVGLQTDYCMDATIKCGFEHGFHMIVPAYANSTVDSEFMSAEESYHYYNDFIWKNRYAQCISLSESFQKLQKK